MKKWFLLLVSAFFLIVSCGETTGVEPENKGVAGFTVEFADDFDLGSPEKRISNPDLKEGIPATISVTALGYDKKPLTDYNGKVEMGMLYGSIRSVGVNNVEIDIVNGKSENVAVRMRNCLDYDRVVVQEKNSKGEFTGKIGVSPVFYTQVATISAIQGNISDDYNDDPNYGYDSIFHGRNLTLKDRKMVVIAVIEGGFYLHEVGVEDYSSIYMYTYSTPYVDDNIEEAMSLPVGTLIESANGSVFEFFGFTEMSFPTFHPVYEEKDGKKVLKIDTDLIPKPYDVSGILDNGSEMEKHEASLVKVTNVSVAWFPDDDSSFVEYSQFPLETSDGKTIMAQTLYTAPLFDALAEKPKSEKEELKYSCEFTGILKQHTSARPSTWILVPRDMNDIKCSD